MKEDAFTLEQRLDEALEEDRLNRKAPEDERARQPFEEQGREQDDDQRRHESEELPTSTAQEEEYGTRSVGDYGSGDDSQAWNGNGVSFLGQQHGDGHDVPFEAQRREYAAEVGVKEEEEVLDGGRAEVSGVSHEHGVSGDVDGGDVGVGGEEHEVDFVGEDEEDNVWQ